ncbi:MAG: alkaline phosphatase family protein [Acidimicrobiia bacterium]|nr:alkaline phosphatase family protein [Acidimicrobiia bacterium]
MAGVILVLCDGLGDAPARSHMGFMEHLVEEGRATRFTSRAARPTNSRPNYETLHTGVSPAIHGVTSNLVVRRSERPNTFSLAAARGLSTAASAHSWMSELYVATPFDVHSHMEVISDTGPIHHGRFYIGDNTPDVDVFARAATLVSLYQPDYLLVHPMAVDNAGHEHGGASGEYAAAVSHQDELLATTIPAWTAHGYTVLVTGDHGHKPEGGHGGNSRDEVETPLYVASGTPGRGDTNVTVNHTQIAPAIWGRLGLIDTPQDVSAANGLLTGLTG